MENFLKVIIIGCGRVSVKHIKAIKASKGALRLMAVVDTNQINAQKVLSGSGMDASEIKVYSDFKTAIAEVKPDIVAVTVPSGLHYTIAEYCLNNGCNLLLEKPMSMSSEECRKIYELSQKTGRKIAMGHIYRYFPFVGILKKDIEDGKFGKVTHGTITVRWGHGQDYYDSSAWRGTWKSDGGAMMNQTVHAIDLLVWLMGGKAVEASSMIARRTHKMEAEDLGFAILRLDTGALAEVEGTTSVPDTTKEADFRVFCENGDISMGLKNGMPHMKILGKNGKNLNFHYFCEQVKLGGFKSIIEMTNPHTGIYKDLYKSILENKQPVADALAGYTSVDNLMGIYKSAKLGEVVKLPLDESFSSTDMSDYTVK